MKRVRIGAGCPRPTRSPLRATLAPATRLSEAGKKHVTLVEAGGRSAIDVPFALIDPAGVTANIRAVLVAAGYLRRRNRVPAWPTTFNDREVLAAWTWRVRSGAVCVIWARGVVSDEVGIYSFENERGQRGTWFTAPAAGRTALHIAGLGQMLRDQGFGPAMNIGRAGDLVSDLVTLV